jgi:hypothetical protein
MLPSRPFLLMGVQEKFESGMKGHTRNRYRIFNRWISPMQTPPVSNHIPAPDTQRVS